MKKRKRFNHCDYYIENKISEIIGISTHLIGYDSKKTNYYYWYDKSYYKTINEKKEEIKDVISKIENKDIMIDILKEYVERDYCLLIVGIIN